MCKSHCLRRSGAALCEARRCLTLDWRGHGESEQPVLDFGAAELVEDALAVVRAGSAECVVPVALAHSGWVAVELRRKLGDRVPKIVLLDWLITDAPKPFFEALSGMQSENHWRATVDGIFEQWLHSTNIEKPMRFVKIEMGAYGFEMWSRAAREIVTAYAIWGRPLDALAQLDPPIPVLHLHGRSTPPSFSEAQQEFARTHTWFRAYELDAQSHFPMFEAPGDMARLIVEFAG